MQLTTKYSFSSCLLALCVTACGSDDKPAPVEPEPVIKPEARVWQRQTLRDFTLDEGTSGLTSRWVKVLIDEQAVANIFYYAGNEQSGYEIIRQRWDAESKTLLAAESIIKLDKSNVFSVAMSGEQLYSAYQGGEARLCQENMMSDAMFSVSDGAGSWHEHTAGIGYVERNPVVTDGLAGSDISIVADSAGGVHVSYQFFYEGCDSMNTKYPDLLYVYKAAGSFDNDAVEQTIEGSELEVDRSQNNVGQFNQIILDSNEQPLVFYAAVLADNSFGLRFSYQENGQWQNEWLEQGCQVKALSAMLSPEGQPAVAYYLDMCSQIDEFKGEVKGEVRYAVKTAEGWQKQLVADKSQLGKYVSLAFDSAGQPAIAYQEMASYSGKASNDLHLSRFIDGSWLSEKVATIDNIGWYNNLWFGDDASINIVSYSSSDKKIYWFSK